MTHTENNAAIEQLFASKIVVLDGAMGTRIQRYGLEEGDYRGSRFKDASRLLKGNNDLLVLTQPEIIETIHREYFEAGADIVETNTFNANAISMADYGMEDLVRELNREAARVARRAAEACSRPGRPRFVAGAIGPTTKTASLSPNVNDPAFRAVNFDMLVAAYQTQIEGLVEGGVDLLLPETTFDTLNLKACLFAIQRFFEGGGRQLPVLASVTITDRSGRTLSGQTVEAFWNSISHVPLLGVGLNCALGAADMRPYLEELSKISPTRVFCYPNAGLPNAMGGYDETPGAMAATLRAYAKEGWLNLVGGCCGTGPEHIQAIAAAMEGLSPRETPKVPSFSRYSGLEAFTVRPESNLVMVGERTNVTGSRKFARLIKDSRYEEALTVARQQVEGGANVLDVNMDEGMLDSEAVMVRFLNYVGSEPDISRLPIMVDSSKFSVLEAGLKCLQGKAIVNSISLKEGEASFLAQARLVRKYGAAVIVMAFDEEGQATDAARKVEICRRAYKLLTEQAGFAPQDIIFDVNVLTVGTGIAEHNGYALSFFDAVRQLKTEFPLCRCSGGISNVSFAFRGNDRVREAMHAAFLYHGIRAGLDMAIVNAGQLAVYDEIPAELRTLVEDVLLDRHPEATERLIDWGKRNSGVVETQETLLLWRQGDLTSRIVHAIMHGDTAFIEADMDEALTAYPTPLSIIEGPLMAGMSRVGDLFGAGKMFLPQVVKSARVMKKAVARLEPYFSRAEGSTQGTILMATVKGDVHDIGKNIVGVVLGCNNYRIVDLGVMVPSEVILAKAKEVKADIIGLSGLITPSLDEMVHVAKEMERQGMSIPLLIGGATTSAKHTAVKIAQAYRGPVVHVKDASRAVPVAGKLVSDEHRPAFDAENRAEQATARERWAARQQAMPLLSMAEIRAAAPQLTPHVEEPAFWGSRVIDLDLATLVDFIDWGPFFRAWELKGHWRNVLEDPEQGPAAQALFADAQKMLASLIAEKKLSAKAVYGFFPAARDGDDVLIYSDGQRQQVRERLCFLRQQELRGDGIYSCLSDFVAPVGTLPDSLGAFVVTAGLGAEALAEAYEANHDPYNSILIKALADRLAEAGTEWLHAQMRKDWQYGAEEQFTNEDLIRGRYRGIRPAPGYPACPDHTEKDKLFRLLDAGRIGASLTSSFAMSPAASVSGFVFQHPESRYFVVGRIGREQVEDYARRKGMDRREVERWLAPNLGYDTED